MAAPAYQAKGTLGEGTGTTISFSYPTLAASDLLYLLVFNKENTSVNTDSSWTRINYVATSNNYGFVELYYKIATGSESGSENVTRTSGSTQFAAQVFSFRGDAFITIESNATQKGASDTITWPAITVGGSQRVLAAFLVNIYGVLSANVQSTTPPTGYTSEASDGLTDASYFELFSKDNVSSDGSVTGTGGSLDEWVTIHHSIYNNTPTVTVARTFIVN